MKAKYPGKIASESPGIPGDFDLSAVSASLVLPVLKKKGEGVRTTFRLWGITLLAIDNLVSSDKSTKKAVFDLLNDPELLEKIADALTKSQGNFDHSPSERQPQVVDRLTLNLLNRTAKKFGLNRDILVNVAIVAINTQLESILKNRKEKYGSALEEIRRTTRLDYDLEERVKSELDGSDPLLERMGYIIILRENLENDLKKFIEDGTPLSREFA
jgi:hypothetical protein